jgi:hypothetical protein
VEEAQAVAGCGDFVAVDEELEVADDEESEPDDEDDVDESLEPEDDPEDDPEPAVSGVLRLSVR